MNGGALYRRVHRTIMPSILPDHKLLVRPSVCLFARELMARLTRGLAGLSSLSWCAPDCSTIGLTWTKVTKLGEAWSKTALKVLLDLKSSC